MKISLITTVKNESTHAHELILAILRQSRLPDEWIVVDGGSEDDTAAQFRAVALCKVIIHPCNRARGRNLAIEQASGDVIMVTDAGCVPGPLWVEKLVDTINLDKHQIASSKTTCLIRQPFDAAQQVLLDQFVHPAYAVREPAASCRSLAFPREAWRECAFPEWLEVGEDSYLLTRWYERGWRVVFVPEAAMEWIPPQSFSAFILQYFRYIRGEGQARIHSRRHLLRIFFYLFLMLIAVSGLKVIAISFWLLYLGATSLRLRGAVQNRGIFFTLKTVLWIVPALFAMDIAKTAGYIAGRLKHRQL